MTVACFCGTTFKGSQCPSCGESVEKTPVPDDAFNRLIAIAYELNPATLEPCPGCDQPCAQQQHGGAWHHLFPVEGECQDFLTGVILGPNRV